MNKSLLIVSVAFFFFGLIIGRYFLSAKLPLFHQMGMEEKTKEHLSHKKMMTEELMAEGNYRCCLEKPCAYCLEKTPGHGEGATCQCLEDVINGRHPCGECIGEILEGRGNRFLAKYFAQAIAEEVGLEYKDMIKEIMAQKYEITIEEQL